MNVYSSELQKLADAISLSRGGIEHIALLHDDTQHRAAKLNYQKRLNWETALDVLPHAVYSSDFARPTTT